MARFCTSCGCQLQEIAQFCTECVKRTGAIVILKATSWDGKLPPHIAKNEEIWWEVFPRIRPELPHELLQFLPGVAKEAPSRKTMGKVVLIADIRANLRYIHGTVGGSLLNYWGCYCTSMMDKGRQVYMAGIETKPCLNFSVPSGSFASVVLRFAGRVDQEIDLSDVEREKYDQVMKDAIKEMFGSEECVAEITAFQHGSWEKGLDFAFRAAIWFISNRKEALANIWGIGL